MNKRFYVSSDGLQGVLSIARDRLNERQQDQKLRLSVEEWWETQGWGIPPIPATITTTINRHSLFGYSDWFGQSDPWGTRSITSPFHMAALPRQVATTRYEDRLFYLLARRAGLDPTWLEYTGDIFFEGSPGKKSLLHLHRCSGRGRNGGWKLRKQRLAELNCWNRKPLNTITTDDGQRLVDVHHAWQDQLFNNPRRIDMTEWLKHIGNAKQYYAAALSLYICHGVMFEDFHGGESGEELRKLAQDVFEPAFDTVSTRFGCPPLIVQLPWKEQLGFYPDGDRWNDELIADLLKEITGATEVSMRAGAVAYEVYESNK